MPGVTVTIRGAALAQPRVVVKKSSGRFRAAELPDGSYDLNLTLAGFAPASRPSVLVTRGQPTDLGAITFQLGSRAEPDLEKLGVKPGEAIVAVRTSVGDFTLAIDKAAAPTIAREFLTLVDAHFYDGGTVVPLFAPSQPGERPTVTGLELTMRPDHRQDPFRAVIATSELAREGERREVFGRVWNWPGNTGPVPSIVSRFVYGPALEAPIAILRAGRLFFLDSVAPSKEDRLGA